MVGDEQPLCLLSCRVDLDDVASRLRILLLPLAGFALYLAIAGLLTFLGMPLPIGNVPTVIVLILVLLVDLVSLVWIKRDERRRLSLVTKN